MASTGATETLLVSVPQISVALRTKAASVLPPVSRWHGFASGRTSLLWEEERAEEGKGGPTLLYCGWWGLKVQPVNHSLERSRESF